jgi:hypothetical protein
LTGNQRAVGAIVLVGAAALWAHFRGEPDYDGAEKSVNGFVEVVMPDGAKPGTVIVFAPPNCPSKEAQRARSIHERLTAAGIPAVMSSSYSVRSAETSEEFQARLKRTQSVLSQGRIPIVFVNGMARGNPSAAEAAAEFERTSRGR